VVLEGELSSPYRHGLGSGANRFSSLCATQSATHVS
jgi:hypothetical protein